MPKLRLAYILIFLLFPLTLWRAGAQDDISPAMQEQLDAVGRAVEQLRQLQLLDDAPLTFPSRPQLETFLRRRLADDFPPESLAADLLFYRALDLASDGLDLETALFEFWLTWIGGYYDIETDRVNLVFGADEAAADMLTIPQQVVYAHELIHALQDQHFDLERIIDEANQGRNRDRRLAIHALFEGDANFIMMAFLHRLMELDQGAVSRAYAALPELRIDKALPDVIIQEIEFPYRNGHDFVEQLTHALGWKGVNAALRDNPPSTTEQIYHPQRYLAGDGAIRVDIPDATAIVGEGWQMAYDGPVGEFYLRQHLALYLNPPQVDSAASGWGGDRLQIYTDDTGDQLAWALFQVWDTPEDAAEFARAYRYLLNRRYRVDSQDGFCWIAETARCIAQLRARETRFTAAPSGALALALLQLDS